MEKENNHQKLSEDIQSIDISGNKIAFLDSTNLVTENKALVEIEYTNGNKYRGFMFGNKRHGEGCYTFSSQEDQPDNIQNPKTGS